jgi:hypothetical protein
VSERPVGATVVALPNSHTAAAVSLAATSSAAFSRFETHELIEASDLDAIAGRLEESSTSRRAADSKCCSALPTRRGLSPFAIRVGRCHSHVQVWKASIRNHARMTRRSERLAGSDRSPVRAYRSGRSGRCGAPHRALRVCARIGAREPQASGARDLTRRGRVSGIVASAMIDRRSWRTE